jgi:hypothetical protein
MRATKFPLATWLGVGVVCHVIFRGRGSELCRYTVTVIAFQYPTVQADVHVSMESESRYAGKEVPTTMGKSDARPISQFLGKYGLLTVYEAAEDVGRITPYASAQMWSAKEVARENSVLHLKWPAFSLPSQYNLGFAGD